MQKLKFRIGNAAQRCQSEAAAGGGVRAAQATPRRRGPPDIALDPNAQIRTTVERRPVTPRPGDGAAAGFLAPIIRHGRQCLSGYKCQFALDRFDPATPDVTPNNGTPTPVAR